MHAIPAKYKDSKGLFEVKYVQVTNEICSNKGACNKL